MRLTNLEIKGFKSFADKTNIHFDQGVTAIVGPNGCGKSNIVDAIRWVLGEQKYSMLRSEKMENLIFNGTKKRKPTNIAEVSLSFDNTKNILPTDYSTITITRRLYRGGESEYLLNGVTCRLKDINDLFMDTGIGTDSYSIIELKMIDDILNDKENARVKLFEEAAGISKYKTRKKQTLQKLEAAENDLTRVEDLLFEIETNLKTLEAQAKKTQKYYTLKEEYKTLSTELIKFTITNYHSSFDELKIEEEKINNSKLETETQIHKSESEFEKAKMIAVEKEKQFSEDQKLVNDQLTLIRQYENDKKIRNERLNFLRDKEQNLKTQLQTDKNTIILLKKDVKILDEDKEKEQSIFAEMEFNLKELKAEVDNLKKQQDSSKLKRDKVFVENQKIQLEVHNLEKSIEINNTQISSCNNELERNSNDYDSQQKELKGIEKELGELTQIKDKKETAFAKIDKEQKKLQEEITSFETKISQNTHQLYESNRKLDAKQNEYNLTKSLIENLEGFPESIKFLKKEAPWNKNAPLLSDIISCKADFRVPIESYLEPYMNYFIVQTSEEAKTAVNILTQASKGRANFFILDNFEKFPGLKNVDSLTHWQGNITHAIDLIEADTKYKLLIQFLLGNVYILENEKQINDINQILNDSDKNDKNKQSPNANSTNPVFLLKNGTMLKTAFTLSGGSVGLFEGKRTGRIKNLEILSKEIKQLETSTKKIKAETEKQTSGLNELKSSAVYENFNMMKDELNELNNQYLTLKTKQEQYAAFINNYADRKTVLEKNLTDYAQKLQELKSQFEKMNNNKINLNTDYEDSQNEYNKVSEKVNTKVTLFNEDNIKLHQQQNKLNGIEREIIYKNTQTEATTTRIGNNTIEFDKVLLQIKEITADTETEDVQLVEMYDKKEKLDKILTESEEIYYKSRGIIDEIEKTIRNFRNNKEHIVVLENELKDKTNNLKLQLNSLKERLSIEFNIKLEEILNEKPNTEFNEQELKERVDKIKQRLDNYGAINPMAVEAYDEIKKRHTFIVEQKQDLVNAKTSLLQTISEIEKVATEKFIGAFNQIRSNFISVFRSLFSEEDTCDLILSDQNNPLESSIDIIAKPKGKRPLTINQLSGGEKTLTATALLFALYLLKPAPFCVFDEVDAPLDDTNIVKFNKIIEQFSTNSQFIIITHNQRTMSYTQVMYGVTMPEQGISKLVPVDLKVLN